ncbi:MAG: hypothetical protein H7Y38_03060 [Armatimonadetes bacterium]|nr:hypothetical protein [Armatimonadota bacterium]
MLSIFKRRQRFVAELSALIVFAGAANAVPFGDISDWESSRRSAVTSYRPTDLKGSEAFGVILEDPVNLRGKDLSAYLSAKMDSDATGVAKSVSDRTSPKSVQKSGLDIVTSTMAFVPKSGENKPRILIYELVRRPDGLAQLARVIASPDKALIGRYLPIVTDAVLANVRGGGAGKTQVASSGGTKSAKTKPKRGTAAYTSPGRGVKASQVFGIYSKTVGRTGAGGMLIMQPVPMVMLNDGTFFNDFDVPLSDFDVAAARIARPTAWDKWRKRGGVLEEQYGKSPWEKVDWYGPLPAAKPNEKLNGFYSSLSGGGNTALGGGTMIVVTNDITFLPDGRFKAGRFVGAMSSEGGAQTTVQNQKNTDGTYTLSGYTMTLKYNDGRVERKAFAFMDKDGKKDALYLDGSPYLKK